MAGRPKPKLSRADRAISRAQEGPPPYAQPWMGTFLEAFAAGANVTRAAKAAGVHRNTIYDARERDERFAGGWNLALEQAQDRIRAEIDRRAIEGWEEPVFGSVGNYMDGQIGTIRKFDNGLLARLAVAHCPEFKEQAPANVGVNINITISPERLQQLQERTRAKLTGQANGRN